VRQRWALPILARAGWRSVQRCGRVRSVCRELGDGCLANLHRRPLPGGYRQHHQRGLVDQLRWRGHDRDTNEHAEPDTDRQSNPNRDPVTDANSDSDAGALI
jgi:hypothetical protein